MRTWKQLAIAATLATAISAPALAADNWQVDKAHTSVGFETTHMLITKVRGEFTDYNAEIRLDPADLSSLSLSGTIEVSSIDTRNDKRDDHLRSDDFFDVENHPQITFTSKKVVKKRRDHVLVGDLTIRGTTREVELPFTIEGPIKDPWGNDRIGFRAETTINRMDFGIRWANRMDTGGLIVGEQVKIVLEGQATRQ